MCAFLRESKHWKEGFRRRTKIELNSTKKGEISSPIIQNDGCRSVMRARGREWKTGKKVLMYIFEYENLSIHAEAEKLSLSLRQEEDSSREGIKYANLRLEFLFSLTTLFWKIIKWRAALLLDWDVSVPFYVIRALGEAFSETWKF